MLYVLKRITELTKRGILNGWYAPLNSETIHRTEIGKFHLWLEKIRTEKWKFFGLLRREYDRYVFYVLHIEKDNFVVNTRFAKDHDLDIQTHALWVAIEEDNGKTPGEDEKEKGKKELLAILNLLE